MILVSTPLGTVGRAVVRHLRERGVAVRAGDRHLDRVGAAYGSDVDAVRLDLADPETYRHALVGCQGLFLVRPPAIANTRTTLNVLVREARAAGVATIVFLSVAGAARNPLVPHHAVERALTAGPADWTILRPGFFAQNFETAYRADILEDTRVYVPAGRGHVAFVDTRDLGELAARVLVEPAPHRRRAYLLTGPEAITFDEACAMLSVAIGRTVRYEPASILGYARHLRHRGLPAMQIVVQTILHLGLRVGQAATVDSTLGQLLGRAPRSFHDYVADASRHFRPV